MASSTPQFKINSAFMDQGRDNLIKVSHKKSGSRQSYHDGADGTYTRKASYGDRRHEEEYSIKNKVRNEIVRHFTT